MLSLVDDKELLKKYTEVWKKIEDLIGKNLIVMLFLVVIIIMMMEMMMMMIMMINTSRQK